jgi:hypothetical protein
VIIRDSKTAETELRVKFVDFDDSSEFIIAVMPIVTSGHSGRLEFTANWS